ncbi:hypothetical protein WICPIJ_002680 [Wickerhamomyces pijperi]|uniref:UBR-type domain-containing protein n=1 Tax=Wickerhamomyces pijperi TaxID=599730 RepID=A0A9P8Q8N7_WICPI|nr:hypothetical protein WICPIJ_002680 [Wickerhamomyces pijperi]
MSQETVTVQEFLLKQQKLESDAFEALPYDPKECSYSLGPLRQQLYACLTCFEAKNPECKRHLQESNPNDEKLIYNAVCYTCSIKCHTTHHLIPLYTKRNFQCDCGTIRVPSDTPCQARSSTNDIPSATNRYNLNFEGKYCTCQRMYDEEDGDTQELADQGTMIQCMLGDVCGEDWFHEGCILGLKDCVPKEEGQLPDSDDFDAFICWKCHEKWHKEIDEMVDIEGVLLKEVDRCEMKPHETYEDSTAPEQESKKRKLDPTPSESSIFLKNGYKHKLSQHETKTQSLKSFLKKFKHISQEDPVYEPPMDQPTTDKDSLDAMNTIPRDQAIEGIMAYNDIKDKLKGFLKAFAEGDKIVEKEDISAFFDMLKKGQ